MIKASSNEEIRIISNGIPATLMFSSNFSILFFSFALSVFCFRHNHKVSLHRNPDTRLAYWQVSHSGLSIKQNLASSTTPPWVGTAFSAPARPVDFSAEVAPNVRRE